MNYNNYIMNFQDHSKPKVSSTQIAYSINCDLSSDRTVTVPEQQSQLENQHPNFYWKTNYYLTLKSSSQQNLTAYQFQDGIQRNCLHAHKQVIGKTLKELQKVIQINQSSFDFVNQPLFQISNCQFADRFFQEYVQYQIFYRTQANHFKQYLSKRRDWRKICTKLMQSVQKIFYWQMSYLFYKCILKFVKIKKLIKIQANEIQNTIDQLIDQERKELRQRLIYLRNSQNFDEDLKKIMLSMMLALNSIYTNRYFNNKYLSISYMRDSNDCLKLKTKKMKVINPRRMPQRKFLQQKTNKKYQQISLPIHDFPRKITRQCILNQSF